MLLELSQNEAEAVKDAINNTFRDYDHADGVVRMSLRTAKGRLTKAMIHDKKMRGKDGY